MSSLKIEEHRAEAEVYAGDSEICQQKSLQLLREISLPNGLLPLEDISEVGYNRSTGFIWLKQKKPTTCFFPNIKKNVWYGEEITGFVEKHRMKRLSGVKSKELLIWVTIGDIYIDEKDSAKIVFKNPQSGISKAFPVSAFVVEEKEKGAFVVEEKENEKEEEEEKE